MHLARIEYNPLPAQTRMEEVRGCATQRHALPLSLSQTLRGPPYARASCSRKIERLYGATMRPGATLVPVSV